MQILVLFLVMAGLAVLPLALLALWGRVVGIPWKFFLTKPDGLVFFPDGTVLAQETPMIGCHFFPEGGFNEAQILQAAYSLS